MDRAVTNGSVLAANDLGFELLSGRKLPADHARGFEYIAKAALKGYGPAELSAGYALRDGRGVTKNEAQALEMFKRAADHGELRSEEHTSELQSLMRSSYAVFCLKKKNHTKKHSL